MENFSYHIPFYVVTGGVATSGHSSDLNGGGVGLYDRQTWSVATNTGNGKEFFFAQGPIGGKDWYGNPVKITHKSPFFLGKDVEDMYLSKPQRIVNEEWVIGFNGSPSSVSLKFVKGEAFRFHIYLHGQPTYRFFNSVKQYIVSYTPKEDCSTPCEAGDCPEGISDCLTHTQNVIDLINNHTELKKFGVGAKLVTADYVAATTNMEKYCLTLCDNGDAVALQAVKAQAPVGVEVVRTARVGSQSTYQFCQPEPDAAPTDFQQTGDILLATCGVCPAGSTLTEGMDAWLVTRPLAGTEDLNDATARQTYADTIGTAYETAHAKTFDGATAVDPATDTITITAHGFSTGNKVTYADGGGTQVVGLVDGTDYFVIKTGANTLKLATTAANAYAGTAIDITADGVGASHTLTPVIIASFVGSTGGVAIVKLKVGEGIVLTEQLADSIVFSNTEGASCTFDDPAAVAWVACGTGIRSSRVLKIKNINRPDCETAGNRLADITAALAGVVGIQIGTLAVVAGTACKDDYTVSQWSVDCLDEGCLTSNVTFTYDTLPSFENEAWEVVPPVVVENTARKCGIRITGGYVDKKFGNCSFDPRDYYETEPVKMEISLLGEDWDKCDFASRPTVSQSRIGQISRQSGEYIIREVVMKTEAYQKHIDQFSLSPRMREAFDQNLLDMVDRNAFYDLYYVRYKASYANASNRKNEQEKFTTVFAFKEGDAAAKTFETQILDVLTAKSEVSMHTIPANVGGSSGQQGIGS